MSIILTIFAGLGLANIIVNEKIFYWPRLYMLRIKLIGNLVACMACMSFWTGLIIGLICRHDVVMSICIGLATHYVAKVISQHVND